MDFSTAEWRRSSTDDSAENCIEVARVGDYIAVRDGKDPEGPKLIFTLSEWDAFVAGAKDGEFDLP
ncbi:DUF397 domain-containing protein [Carbonactinospora thermoautotrophica]|nr:DUF397 domain-containing protein [Carbonactinospora thermoautotrophica]